MVGKPITFEFSQNLFKNKLMILLLAILLFGIFAFLSGVAYGRRDAALESFQEQMKKESEKLVP